MEVTPFGAYVVFFFFNKPKACTVFLYLMSEINTVLIFVSSSVISTMKEGEDNFCGITNNYNEV